MENKYQFDVVTPKITLHTNERMYDITGSVVSVGTSKKIGTIPGSFDLSIAPTPLEKNDIFTGDRMNFTSSDIYQNEWLKTFKSNDLVEISFTNDRRGMRNYTMHGLINRVRRVRKIETRGKVMHTISITGNDAGKILEKNHASLISNIKVDWANTNKTITKEESIRAAFALPGLASRSDLQARIAGKVNVKKAVEAIMDTYQGLYDGIRWNRDNGRIYWLMGDMINYTEKIDEYPGETIQGVDIATLQGTLTSILERVAEKPFYEMFIDSDFRNPAESFLIVRPVPFSKITQGTLYNSKYNHHMISSSDIIMEDTGKSDSEAFTGFRVSPAFPGMNAKDDLHAYFPTKVIGKLLDRYGLKLLEVTSRNIMVEKDKFINDYSTTGGIDTATKKRKEIIDWYYYNDEFHNGSILINGNDRIRIGEYLWRNLKDDDYFVYYIEGVDQRWSFGQQWVTTLAVTRGMSLHNYLTRFPGIVFRGEPKELPENMGLIGRLA